MAKTCIELEIFSKDLADYIWMKVKGLLFKPEQYRYLE